eukprot:gene19617-26301_t
MSGNKKECVALLESCTNQDELDLALIETINSVFWERGDCDMEVIQLLLEKSADHTSRNSFALHLAITLNMVHVVEVLLQRKVSIEKYYKLPLGHEDMVRILESYGVRHHLLV